VLWALWLVWLLYCVPVARTWCYVWVPLRLAGHRRLSAWAIASLGALLWFTFWPAHKWMNRRQAAAATKPSVADEASHWLASQVK
jgi:hypothetical protein